jgi:hypothetical protein
MWMNIVFIAVFLTVSLSFSQSLELRYPISVTGSYKHYANAYLPTRIALSQLNAKPGDTLILRQYGDYDALGGVNGPFETYRGLHGVFRDAGGHF